MPGLSRWSSLRYASPTSGEREHVGDREPDLPFRGELGDAAERDRVARVELDGEVVLDGAPVGRREHARRGDAELDGLDRLPAQEVEERRDRPVGDSPDAIGEVGAVRERDDPELPEEVEARLGRGADDDGAARPGELCGQAPDAARGRGDHDDVVRAEVQPSTAPSAVVPAT